MSSPHTTTRVVLGELDLHDGRPSFSAQIGNTPGRVELDIAAVFKLLRHVEQPTLHELEAHRGPIRIAAQALNDEGFGLIDDGLSRIMVTALDLV